MVRLYDFGDIRLTATSQFLVLFDSNAVELDRVVKRVNVNDDNAEDIARAMYELWKRLS